MSLQSEIIINAAIHETRIAILENGKLVEIWVERPDNERMVGDVYKGRVKAVIPGIQAAFVDIGMEKSAFLHISDVSDASIDFVAQYDLDDDDEDEDEEDTQKQQKGGKKSRGRRDRKGDRKQQPPIETILKKGQELLVQITKEPISTKGARVTSQLTLPGRFLVLMPGANKIGVSRKIQSWNERKRLKKLAAKYRPKGFGIIIRTVAEGKGEQEVKNEIEERFAAYEKLMKKSESVKTPALIHKEMGMTSGIIRDLLSEDVQRVVLDSEEHRDQITNYLKSTSPGLIDKLTLYNGKEPIFDHFGLEKEIDNIFNRKVWMKSGAFLVMDHTEALTVIDVNSGRNTGSKSGQDETILKINLESAVEIARQLRLRDIGGIIVIDFIDMWNMDHRRKVEDAFADALKNDRSKISISQISEFGLMEMTRQRVRPSLIHTFAEPCPTCGGIGMVQARDTTLTKIERWLRRAEAFGKENSYTVFVHPSVFEFLIENNEERLTTLRSCTDLTIDIVVDSKLDIDEFHCFSTRRAVDVTDEFNPGKRKSSKEKLQAAPTPSVPKPKKRFTRPETPETAEEKEGGEEKESMYGRKPRSKPRR